MGNSAQTDLAKTGQGKESPNLAETEEELHRSLMLVQPLLGLFSQQRLFAASDSFSPHGKDARLAGTDLCQMARNLKGLNKPVDNVFSQTPSVQADVYKSSTFKMTGACIPLHNKLNLNIYMLIKEALSKPSINFSKSLLASVTNCANKKPRSFLQQADPLGSSRWLRTGEK